MSKAPKISRKVIIFCALGLIIPLALIWINMIAIQHDAANKREYDELIRKQQALVQRDRAAASEVVGTEPASTVQPNDKAQ